MQTAEDGGWGSLQVSTSQTLSVPTMLFCNLFVQAFIFTNFFKHKEGLKLLHEP
jgi:hypothetical protein